MNPSKFLEYHVDSLKLLTELGREHIQNLKISYKSESNKKSNIHYCLKYEEN